MTTIRDVAREAGVSVSTVSRVIAGHPDVSTHTSDQVQAVIERMHFLVNRNAQTLKQSGTTTILVMIKGRYNMLFAAMLEQVHTEIALAGYSVVPQFVDEDANEVDDAERLIAEVKPRGILFLGGDADNLRRHAWRIGAECPAVVLTNSTAELELPAVSSLTTDDQQAARRATDYLLDHGHRQIGVIGGNPSLSTISRHRQNGVIDALAARGLGFDLSTHYAETHYSLKCGYDAAVSLLESAPALSAIYAMSDIMALGSIRALADHGLNVPGDISLIGHDGIELAGYSVPKLATVRQPREAIVRRGVEILLSHIGGDHTPVHEVLDVEIVEAESVRALL